MAGGMRLLIIAEKPFSLLLGGYGDHTNYSYCVVIEDASRLRGAAKTQLQLERCRTCQRVIQARHSETDVNLAD